MVPGDDRRRIHFRKSASAGKFLIAEREDEHARRLTLVVDNTAVSGSALEEDIENAAALIHRLDASGAETGLSVSGSKIPPGTGPAHVSMELRVLALTEASPKGPKPELGDEAFLDVSRLRNTGRNSGTPSLHVENSSV